MKKNKLILVALCIAGVIGVAACGGGEAAAKAETGSAGASAEPAAASEAPAAKGTPLDNARFSTIMPDGWRIHADDLERMGMMTIVYGSKYEGVYFKFESSTQSMDDMKKQLTDYAKKQNGTDPAEVKVNDRTWYSTTYDFGGKQSMMVTEHNGNKVTLTIVGDGYGENPGVTAVVDKLVLK